MKSCCVSPKFADYQPLFLRISLLYVLFAHGWTKLTGGVERRTGLGEAMSTYGIDFLPAMRGFFAAYAESVGIILIVLGILTRFNAFFLAFTMLTVILMKVTDTPGIERLGEISAPVFILAIAIALLLSGAGKYFNRDRKIFGCNKQHGTQDDMASMPLDQQ